MNTQKILALKSNTAIIADSKVVTQSVALGSSYLPPPAAKLVFIDSDVDGYQVLASGICPAHQVHILKAHKDGIEQITHILSKYERIATIHIISHGAPGSLQLGATQLNNETIHQYRSHFKTWSNFLCEQAQLLLYGCCVAQGEQGLAFVNTFSQLVNAGIAASTTMVGSARKAGNWDLDVQTQAFSPTLAFEVDVLASYPGTFTVQQAFSGITPIDSVDSNEIGSLKITITPNSGIQKSNFSTSSFTVENTGDKRIAAIYLDVTDALFPDTVFDPVGLAGDTVSRGLKFNFVGNTGVFEPTQEQVLEPFFGAGGTSGYEGMRLVFDHSVDDGYNPGEVVQFGVDMDPNSIVGLPQNPVDGSGNEPLVNSWDIGGVSGAELMNSRVHVLFTDGTTAVAELIGDGSQSGSVAVVTQASLNKQANLTVNGLSAGANGDYSQSNIQVQVSGNAGDTVRVVMVKGFIQPFDYIDANGNLFNVSDNFVGSPFPANNALQFQTVDVTLDGTTQDITNAFDFSGPDGNLAFPGNDKLPVGFVSSVIDAEGLPIGPVTEPIYLVHSDAGTVTNTAPTTSGIADVAVEVGAADTVISLFDAFEDAQSSDADLSYSVAGNTNPALFDAATIDPVTGELVLDYAAAGTGSSEITIEAEDPEGLTVSTTFTVTVNEIGDPVDPVEPGDA
ncbi:MAG: DUF4347 domain-containing protein, partial [Cyanobacteria bacterium P01_D01_bin.105]